MYEGNWAKSSLVSLPVMKTPWERPQNSDTPRSELNRKRDGDDSVKAKLSQVFSEARIRWSFSLSVIDKEHPSMYPAVSSSDAYFNASESFTTFLKRLQTLRRTRSGREAAVSGESHQYAATAVL